MSPPRALSTFLLAAICSLLACLAAGKVFRVSYIGCFIDNAGRDLKGLSGISQIGEFSVPSMRTLSSDSMTHEFCSSFCSLGGFPYFGVQSSWACFCAKYYGSLGPASESDCNKPCTGNSSQICGSGWRNSVFALTYPKQRCFKKSQRPSLTVSATHPISWTVNAVTDVDCLILCEASPDCQAVIFSGQQRLCHLLRFAYPPASLSSVPGDYFVRG